MTPLETLGKYGLKTDVKSIKERIEKSQTSSYFYGTLAEALLHIDHIWNTEQQYAEKSALAVELRTADLTLLCSLAEKGERWERAVKDLKALEICRHTAVDSYIENWEKSLHSAKIEACEEIITEAEGEGK